MHKLSYQRGDRMEEHSYPPLYTLKPNASDPTKVLAGASGVDPLIFCRLVACIRAPYFLLYVLHTPRGEGEPGRYQSTELNDDEFNSFMLRYSKFLSGDARHDFWVHSPDMDATVVWDRHNLIHAYGPIDCYVSTLRGLGFSPGDLAVPIPHNHYYRSEFDADAKSILSEFAWERTSLRPEDEQ